jgi:hypothetical protein
MVNGDRRLETGVGGLECGVGKKRETRNETKELRRSNIFVENIIYIKISP